MPRDVLVAGNPMRVIKGIASSSSSRTNGDTRDEAGSRDVKPRLITIDGR